MRLAYWESLQDALTLLTVRTAPLLPATRSTWMQAIKEQDTPVLMRSGRVMLR